jgi:hypothetical protein
VTRSRILTVESLSQCLRAAREKGHATKLDPLHGALRPSVDCRNIARFLTAGLRLFVNAISTEGALFSLGFVQTRLVESHDRPPTARWRAIASGGTPTSPVLLRKSCTNRSSASCTVCRASAWHDVRCMRLAESATTLPQHCRIRIRRALLQKPRESGGRPSSRVLASM